VSLNHPLVTLAAKEAKLSPGSMVSAVGSSSLPSPQSEAMTIKLDPNMLDTNHCLHIAASSFEEKLLRNGQEKVDLECDRHAYHSLKEVLQLKLQQRRTREELVSQGIMPPLKSSAAFHEQRKSLERARTEDYLKRKIRKTSAEPSLQAKQLKLKRARLADDLNDKISHRPGPIELLHKNILPVHTLIGAQSPKGEGSSLDEDSSDALSPDPLCSQDSPLGPGSQHSPSEMLIINGDMSPTRFLTQAAAPPLVTSDASPPQNRTSETNITISSRPPTGHSKQQSKSSTDRSSQRSKKPKDNKPKVKKLKYHQYIPPDQKNDREPPPQLDSSYAKILHQQQLFLQLQIINQQQQHYNYHTILPAPPKISVEKQLPSSNPGPSPSQTVSTHSALSSNQNTPNNLSQPTVGGTKPSTLPANLDEFKHELKLRGLTVSGTKNDLIERLKNYQEQNSASSAVVKANSAQLSQGSVQSPTAPLPKDTTVPGSAFPTTASVRVHSTTPPQIMRFSSTSSSPPVSPTPSDRSLTGLSPDEASCNGDVFGEMVSSPLTQLSLQPSPDHPSPVKEESAGQIQATCCLSRPGSLPPTQPQAPGPVAASVLAVPPLDKDQMLQEKDKQIEELTRMLLQKQRLVETLRSQLEQGKRVGATEVSDITQTHLASNGVEVKEEVKEEMDTSEDLQNQIHLQKKLQMQCSQQTLLKLQQIHQQQTIVDLKNVQKIQFLPQNKQQEPPKLSQDQEKLQQQKLQLLQQQQKAQLLQQQKALLLQQQKVQLLQQQQQKALLQEQQKTQLQQQQKRTALQQQKLQHLIIQQSQQNQLQTSHKKPKPQSQTPQVSQVFVSQQPGSQITTSFPLDLLKAHPTPTLVTDSNGNRYLIALTSNNVESLVAKSPQSKPNGRITLQRLQSIPTKLPSQSSTIMPSSANQSQALKDPNTRVKKSGLVLESEVVQVRNETVSAPVRFDPFFCEEPKPLSKPSSPPSFKDNVANNQQIDDLFEILMKSGDLHSNPPSPSPPPSPLHISPHAHHSNPDHLLTSSQQLPDTQNRPCSGSGRLEDFLESTTGTPLLGVEPDGPLTLIDDLHNQMLSTSSILDHPPSPMDTSDLSFSSHPASLDFEDATLDGMDWLDIPGVTTGSGCNGGNMVLAPLSSHTPQSVFSADFLDSPDLQLHWDSCL
ncbi:hypothetical protein DNTS_028242, partial [Danionella cerebrum]